ncbi:MAG: hypothetical protein ACK5XN_31025 [Bacteroidota bacterium]|jgi:hypothetical protein
MSVLLVAINNAKYGEEELRFAFDSNEHNQQVLVGQIINHPDIKALRHSSFEIDFAHALPKLLSVISSLNPIKVEFSTWNAPADWEKLYHGWYPTICWSNRKVFIASNDSDVRPTEVSFFDWNSEDDEWIGELLTPHSSECICDDCLEMMRDDYIDNAIDERRTRY